MVPANQQTDFDYKKYLASREWALLKEQVRERSGGTCERCEVGPYQDTHHLTYERVGHEDIDDLQAVCRPCHQFLSAKSDSDPLGQIWDVSERLALTMTHGFGWDHMHLIKRNGHSIEWRGCINPCKWCQVQALPFNALWWT